MAPGGSGRMHACAHQMPLSLIGPRLAARAPCRSALRRQLRRLRRPASGRGCRSQGLVWVCDASSGGEQSADVKQLRGARLNSAPGRRRQQAGSRRRGLGRRVPAAIASARHCMHCESGIRACKRGMGARKSWCQFHGPRGVPGGATSPPACNPRARSRFRPAPGGPAQAAAVSCGSQLRRRALRSPCKRLQV